ncbi:hypothetical protein D3C77_345440 [compost metagenome]
MRLIAQPIDNRNRRIARQIHNILMTEGTNHNTVQVSRHDRGRIGNRLAAAELDVIFAQKQRMPAKLVGSHLEGYPCPRRGLFKNKTDGFSF